MGCVQGRSEDCVFCQLAARPQEFLYEDEWLFIVEDKYPSGQFHLLVIPKVHYRNYRAAPAEYLQHSYEVVRSIIPLADLRMGYHRYYSIPHLHLHCLVPPYTSAFNWLKSQAPFFIEVNNVSS